ncbi:hypothetical protein E3T55_01095 [Cryobacterium frigoriphilum]|uniref:Uncharacterized protein n=1 Tax=Cryobacterium frigoriphilum TaxID=1259150 RepID=A0A4R9AAS9_9MICO|nr:hypothetical protein [Cryobacterium frigoriphilum]TFD55433.1 hypothetical protein E3T55_01095 [Cryobacterium frigoriphilum]
MGDAHDQVELARAAHAFRQGVGAAVELDIGAAGNIRCRCNAGTIDTAAELLKTIKKGEGLVIGDQREDEPFESVGELLGDVGEA